MNKTHFVYLNSDCLHFTGPFGCHDFIHLKKVPIPIKETYTYPDGSIVQRNEIRILDYLRDKGAIDTNIYDEDILDKIMTVRHTKDKRAFLSEIRECNKKYYKEVRITGVAVSRTKFAFDMSLIDRLNNVHRLCTKKARYTISDTYLQYKNNGIVSRDSWICRDTRENYDEHCWFTIDPKTPTFSCGNISVTIPPICVDKDGLTLHTKFLDLNKNYINRCEVFVDISLYFQIVE